VYKYMLICNMDQCRNCDECSKLCEIVPEMAGVFKAMGDLNRLRIIYILSNDRTGKLGVSDLAGELGISQPAVSQHLKTLKGEGIVEARREGLYMYYTLNRDRMVRFGEYFNLMYDNVMERCDKELVRKTIPHGVLNACVIYYSYTGVTRGVAEQICNACGCDLIEVQTRKKYSTFTAYTKGVMRSRKEVCDPIIPGEIDVSQYDLLIIGTPVWAWKPAPAINSAIKVLKGCEGKKAIIFVTSCGQPGEALPLMKKSLESRGVEVIGDIGLTKDEIENPKSKNDLIGLIVAAYSVDNADERIDEDVRVPGVTP
jgi:DNA-binding transcriptional ArsR family regulator